jgi:membrane protease YdiL (CAAX protease family)
VGDEESERVTSRPLLRAAVFVALSAVAVLGYLFLLSVFRGKLGVFSSAVPALVLSIAALILNWRFLRADGGSLAELGFDSSGLRLTQVAIGFLGGCLLAGVWALVLRAVTGVVWQRTPSFDISAATGGFAFAIFNNAAEELIYRGYLFLLLLRSYGRFAAVTVTCGLFTLLHIQAAVPVLSAIAVVLTSSLIFAAAFLQWRSVPLVIALHVATNFVQEGIGLRLSGLTLFVPTFPQDTSARQHLVLLTTALINIAVALAIFARHSGLRTRTPR